MKQIRTMKRFMAFVLALALVAGSLSVPVQAKAKKAVKSVKITNVKNGKVSLKKGKTFTLKTKVTVTGKASKKVTFTSSNKKVATVSKAGKIKAIKKGTARITVKSVFNKKKKVTIKVVVSNPVTTTKPQDQKEETKPSDEQKPSVENPVEKPVEKPSDYYDPSVTYDYQLTNSDSKAADWNKPSISVSENEYKLIWSDNFEGTSLNRDDWNVELHKAGWVNDEQQAYVDSDKNIFVKDGNLVLRPIREKAADGSDYITSGRVNTQNKHDFKYGLFEARVKVPKGQGYLPAFWMMPTDENLYGQWPKCGEIDIMEVMGQETDKLYGTIHYGNPHGSRQGTTKATKGHDYADEYHTYACEWEPGKLTWYVDGVKFHEATNWYTKEEGETPVTYPAPFDQPFYMILNLAVGGKWVGMIDETTQINPAAFVVDYVKAFQKDAYDEEVTMPSEVDKLREPGADGNYMNNSDFATEEALDDESGWVFMTQQGGVASASIKDNQMKIAIEKEGSKDYSVQLVQADLPLIKGATYRIAFDAKADAARSMNCAVKAPNYDYFEHLSENVDLTTSFKSYEFTFRMKEDTDPACRLEFNMGAAGSIADIYLKNVKVEKIAEPQSEQDIEKVVLKDGNSIYNGSFQEGVNRMAYWTPYIDESVASEVTMKVTDLTDGRRLYVNVKPKLGIDAMDKVQLRQTNVNVDETIPQIVSFDAQAEDRCCIEATVLGKNNFINLSSEKQTYSMEILPDEITNRDVVFHLGDALGVKIDNVRLEQNLLIKNGSFLSGTSGFDIYRDNASDASYVIDSLKKEHALALTINNTNDAEWKIQVKQGNVKLEKDQWYQLDFDIQSSIDRSIQYSIQRDGNIHSSADGKQDWTPYVQAIEKLTASDNYTHIKQIFKMQEATDAGSIFNIALGAVNGVQIKEQHEIFIDNIRLIPVEEPEKTEKPETPTNPETPVEPGENILKGTDFTDASAFGANWVETIASWEGGPGAKATKTLSENTIVYDVQNVGTEDWNIQLKQSGIKLEAGKKYIMSYDVVSSVARTIKSGVMSKTYAWYGGQDPVLEANTKKHVEASFTMSVDDVAADFYISLGQIIEGEGEAKHPIDTPTGVITISNIKLIEVAK